MILRLAVLILKTVADEVKIPPHSLEAERAVLGIMIMYPDSAEVGFERLTEDMFYSPAHRIIFSRLIKMAQANQPIDAVTIKEALVQHGELEKIGGAEYLAQIVNSVLTPAHFEEYLNLLEDKALLRRIVKLCTDAINKAYQGPGDVKLFVDSIEAEFYRLSENRLKGDFVHIQSVIKDVHREILELQKSQRIITGISTGYADLDKMLTGFHPSDYVVVAGRTSSGKTAFALSLARNIAIRADERNRTGVAIFSLEMSKEQVVLRLLAGEAKVSAHRMRQGFLTRDELNEIAMKVDRVATAPIFIDDTPNLTVMEMRSKARRLARRVNIGVIIVDYLQLVNPSVRADSRQEEVASVSRALKALARELGVTVVALAQLSRRVEESRDHRPKLSHLRESGAIEQDADVVLLLYRPEAHGISRIEVNGIEMDSAGMAELIVAKQRNGPTGSVYLSFDKECITFEPYEMEYQTTAPVPEGKFEDDEVLHHDIDDGIDEFGGP